MDEEIGKMYISYEYSDVGDIAYIRFVDGGEVEWSHNIEVDNSQIVIDIDKKGKIVGIEVFDASIRIPGLLESD